MTSVEKQKAFQEKIFEDRFEIIQKSNDLLLAWLNKAWKQPNSMTTDDYKIISNIATVRFHFYAELMDQFDRQALQVLHASEQNTYNNNNVTGTTEVTQ